MNKKLTPRFVNYFSRFYFLLFVIFTVSFANAQTCTQTNTVQGYDCDNFLNTITINCAPPGATITNIQITGTIGSDCFSWYEYDINIGGNWFYSYCNGTNNFNTLNGSVANGTVIYLRSWDNDSYCDFVTLGLTVVVSYSCPTPPAPTTVGWTSTGGSFSTPACGANSATVCAGSGVGVQASLVQGVNYTVENLGTAVCGTALPNAYLQAWSPGGTTCGFNAIGTAALNSVTFNAPTSGVHRVNVTSNTCGSTVNSCGGGLGHDFTGRSAVLRYRQNTTVTNTTSTANICLSGSKSLTATLGGAHNNPTVVWSVVSGSGSISGSTFTPSGTGPVVINATVGNCSSSVSFNVSASVTPTFTQVPPICTGGTLSPLPTTSNNGITGSWSPALDNSQTTLYTFTPDPGQCATTTTMTITVNNNVAPSFTQVSAICSGSPLPALPTTSTNGIAGTWSPAMNNTQTTLYTFTPTAGQCASSTTMTITVNDNVSPSFTQVGAICAGDPLADLPTTSTNGIAGTWSPAMNNTQTTLYTFVPTAGQCASNATMTITVGNVVTPSFNSVADVCEGSVIAPLPTTSTNGVLGSWSPALNNTQTTLYTFSPSAGQCAVSTSLTINVIEDNLAVSSDVLSVCPSETATITATGASSYVWSPAIGLNQTTGSVVEATPTSTQTYTVVGSVSGCSFSETITITTKSIPTITAGPVGANLCAGNSISLTATGGVVYVWLPTASSGSTVSVSPLTTTVYTVLGTSSNGCVGQTTLTVNVTTPPTATISYAGSPFCTSVATSQSVTRTGTSGGVYSSTAGLSIDPTTGAINPSLSTPGNYVVTYTIAASGGCPVYTTTANVTITQAPTATFSYAGSPFCGNLNSAQLVTFTGTSGGTFSAPSGLTLDGSTGEIVPLSSASGTYVVNYSIPSGAGCPSFSTTSSVTISTPPSASISYAGTPFCTSITTPQAVDFTGATAGNYSSTAGLTINASTGAITPSTSTAGNYVVTYTVPAANGCPIFTITTPVQINQLPTATISYAGSPFCGNLGAGQNVTLTGTSGGIFSAPLGLTIDASTGSITPSSSTSGTYTVTYTIAAANACPEVVTTSSVTISTPPSASISYAGTPFCTSITTPQAVDFTGATAGNYSSTAGLTINASTGAITPSTSTAGNYVVTYTIPAANGCPIYTITTPVQINQLPTATISYAGSPFCGNLGAGQNVTLTGTSGGIFSAPVGLTIDASTGSITPSSSTSGTYPVTYTIAAANACPEVVTTSSVIITTPPSATISYSSPVYCVGAIGSQSVILTGTSGGTYSSTAGLTINASTGAITPSTSTPGTYTVTYTVAAAGGCPSLITSTTVEIIPIPTATISYAGSPFCGSTAGAQSVTLVGTSGGTFSSTTGLTINATTGAITPSTSTPGTYTVTYTIAAAGGCGVVTATASVQINPAPSATISYAGSPFCTTVTSAQSVTITGTSGGTYSSTAGLTINATTGAITPSTSTPGTYTVTYTVAAAGGCPVYTTTTTVTITALPTATISYAGSPFCGSTAGAQSVTLVGTSGGTFSSTAGLSFDTSTGAITPTASTPGTYTVTYTIAAAGGCGVVTATASVQINPAPTATISYAGSPFCSSLTGAQAVTRTGTSGGTYSSTTGLTINATTGAITPSTSTPGTYTVTYTVAAAGGCPVYTTTTTVTITALPTATISYAGSPFCGSTAGALSVTLVGTFGGTFSSTAGLNIDATTGAITPTTSTAGTYTVTYTIAAAGGCGVVTATTSVQINAAPSATISYAGSPFCTSVTSAQSVTITGTSGGTYSSTAGLTINATTGAITPSTSTPGTYTVTYTVAAAGGCPVYTTTATVTITALPTATISYVGSPFCGSTAGAQSVTLVGTSGGTFSSTAGLSIDASTGAITPTTSTTGTYTVTYTIAAAGGCGVVTATTSVQINPAPTATISYAGSPFCSSLTGAQAVTRTGTSGGTYSSTAGLTINATTGAITPSTSTPGTYTVTYTVAAAGGCPVYTTTTTVTITALPTATISYAGSPFCGSTAGAQSVTLVGTSGGTFSSTAGLSIDASTGAITPTTSTPGTYTVTYTIAAAGGCGVVTATTSVQINPAPSATISYAGSPFCSSLTGAQAVTRTGTSGGTYSSTAGLTINATTGAITPSTSIPGTYTVTYTVAAAGGCPDYTTTTTVTITALPTATISFAGSPFCGSTVGAQSVTSVGTSGGTFSSTAGLSIDASTGAITPTTSTTGTYTVTYTIAAAGGCGVVTATTSVQINAAPSATISYFGSPFCSSTAGTQSVTRTGTSGGTYSSTAGLTINATTGAITPSTSTPGTYTVTYTVAAAGGCPVYTTTTTVTITALPTATISYAGSPFCGDLTTNQTVILVGTSGGTFSSTAGLAINSTTGDINPSLSTSGTYTVTYTIAAAGGCGTVTTTTSISVSPALAATISYNGSPFCSTLNLPQSVSLVGTGGGIFSSTAGLTINATTGTITPSSSTPGTYTVTYTLAAAGGCPTYTTTTTVEITQVPLATINYPASPYCVLLTGDQSVNLIGDAGGIFSSTAGLSLNATTGGIDPSLSTPNSYTVTYTLPATGGCASSTTTTQVVITSALVPTIDYGATQFCSVISSAQIPTITGTNGGVFSSTPAGLTINPTTGAVIPSTSTAGVYTINYDLNFTGCSALNTSVTFEVVTSPVVTIAYAGSYCTSLSTPQTPVISGTGNISGGTFSATPAGLNINPTTGAITPSGSTDGNYVVTYTVPAGSGCGAATGTFNVSIISPLTAVISYASQSYCSDVSGQQVVNFSGATGGTFSSTSGLSLNALTGSITPSTSTSGTYTVTYVTPPSGSCPPGTASTTVTILAAPDVNPLSDVSFCDQTFTLPAISGTNLTGNEAYFTGTNGTGIVFNAGDILTTTQQLYIYDVNGVCSDEESFTVTINQTPVISSPGDQISCGAYSLPVIVGTNLSGNENYYNNSQTNGGTVISGPITETQIVWIFDTNGVCSDEVSFLVIVNTAPDASFTATNYCDGVGTAPTVTGEAGGIFSLDPLPTDGATIDPSTGIISNGVTGSSYTIVYTVNGSCTASTSQTVSFVTKPSAPLLASDTTYCSNDLNTPLTAVPQSSGTISWFDDANLTNPVGTGITFSPINVTGTTTYYVTETVNGCSSLPSAIDVTVNASPAAPTAGPNATYCYGDSLNVMLAVGNPGNTYAWYLDVNLTNNVGTGDSIKPLYLNGATSYYVTQTSINGCRSEAAEVIITINDCFEINVPSAFTPGDGDNVNGTWEIDQLNVRFPSCKVSVFNRWGQIIFESNGYAVPWDGTYKGELVPVASYYYIIEFNDAAKTPSAKGTVTIIRN